MSIPRISPEAAAPQGYEKVPAPGVEYRMNVATASSAPWVNANGWRFERRKTPGKFYDVSGASTALAAAEAFAYDVEAVIHTDEPGLKAFEKMVEYLKRIEPRPLPVLANIGVIDDGSAATGEILNLLARRNLLFKIVSVADPRLNLNIKPDAAAASNPNTFAQRVRQQLTDSKRLLRIYGSEVVLGRLTGDGARTRLHLLNYDSRRSIPGVRVRVLGSYQKVDGVETPLQDVRRNSDATEFTVPEVQVYSAIDLAK